MILVGLKARWMNAAGASDNNRFFFTAVDVHEAAVETLKTSWATPWQSQSVEGGEFHDTDTLKTWSVDSGGHTKRDYKRETTESFVRRWKLHD